MQYLNIYCFLKFANHSVPPVRYSEVLYGTPKSSVRYSEILCTVLRNPLYGTPKIICTGTVLTNTRLTMGVIRLTSPVGGPKSSTRPSRVPLPATFNPPIAWYPPIQS